MRVDVKRCAVRPGGARVPSLACSRTKAKSPSDPRSRTRVLRYTRSRPGMSGQKKTRLSAGSSCEWRSPLIVYRESDSRDDHKKRDDQG